jgi:hypothetical protein
MNLIRGLFFFTLCIICNYSHGQILRASAAVTLNSVNHATCYGAKGDLNLNLTLINPPASNVIGGYTLVVNKDGAYYTTLSSATIQSSTSIVLPLTNLLPGIYDVSGTIISTNTSAMTSTSFTVSLTYIAVGYHAVWVDLKEMTAQTIPSTVLQSVTTPSQTYAGARASNTDIGDFWLIAAPAFNNGNVSNRSVYVSLVNTASLVSFIPASHYNYLEFRKAGSDPLTGDGVYYKSTSGTFKLAGVTYTDKIRVERVGSTISFYKDQSTTPLASGSTNPYTVTNSSQINITAFTSVISDGVNVGTSFKCNSSSEVYATLFNELDGYYYNVKNGKLRFIFNQNYDTQNNLKFNIYNQRGALLKTQTNYPAVQATYGDNYLTIDLTTTDGCIGRGMFSLEVISDKKEKMYLRFYNEYNGCIPVLEQDPGGFNPNGGN